MKNNHPKQASYSFQPILKSKYLIILLLLGILAIMSPSFLSHYDLWIGFVAIGFIALVTLGLYTNVRFQKLHKKLRPFVVVRILQTLAVLGFALLIYRTYAMAPDALIPYIVFYLLALITVYQFFNIFRLAKQAKKDYPDRCEFC